MKEIAVLSGKGGTGKTSVVASFATLAKGPLVLGDCDVDAANLALLLPGEDGPPEAFLAGERARIDEERCSGCGTCVDVCRFHALTLSGDVPTVDDVSCEGCRACSLICEEEAIRFIENRAGTILQRETDAGPLVHGSLGIAQDNSGKMVTRIRTLARAVAEERGIDTVLYDGPPGIGCPVHATLGGVSLVVAVTDPTPSGVHDVERLMQLTEHFRLRTAVAVNKFDLDEDKTRSLHRTAEAHGASVLGGIPFDREVPRMLALGKSPLEVPAVGEALQRIWRRIEKIQLAIDN